MIQFKNVSKTFTSKSSKVEALKDVSLEINDGDIFGVIGYSGAGKSTLIRMVNFLEQPTKGQVIVNGVDLAQISKGRLRDARKTIGMIFQQFNLLESKTVYENIALPLKLNHVSNEKINKRVNELLSFVELEDKIQSFAGKLSGGQKQRVGIARALAMNPSILLCDEATSALDPKTTDSILKLLKRINKEFNITILLITHEMNVIRKICNKVAVMENGKIVEKGEVIEVFGNPVEEITRDFVKTVIDDELPESIKESFNYDINNDNRYSEIAKLKFNGSSARDSLISNINKKFDVETNILYATVYEIQGTSIGIIILKITGNKTEVQNSVRYIEGSKVNYERVFI